MKKSQKSKQEDIEKLLKIGAEEIGCYIGEREIALFLKYLEELKEWNKKINLTAIKDDKDIIIKHFLDSLILAPFLKSCKNLLDIGSGAGFPGIPLKIVMPELKVALLDANNKKVSFTNHIIRMLGLKDIETVHARAEDEKIIKKLGKPAPESFNRGFDAVTSRAFAELKDFLKTAKPYAKERGLIISMKGPKGIEELDRAKKIEDLTLVEKKAVKLPFSDIMTSVFVFKKV
ncbi:MAG: 16S rRNA (guanine(527)-N(7))-methyltransferase RsmG [Deltaproteobacteria bacterium]|nr:16S rRNA (guanine(527)-N(7))-methyltransferase RsmG [Deltaproteobacteria bacterium]